MNGDFLLAQKSLHMNTSRLIWCCAFDGNKMELLLLILKRHLFLLLFFKVDSWLARCSLSLKCMNEKQIYSRKIIELNKKPMGHVTSLQNSFN